MFSVQLERWLDGWMDVDDLHYGQRTRIKYKYMYQSEAFKFETMHVFRIPTNTNSIHLLDVFVPRLLKNQYPRHTNNIYV